MRNEILNGDSAEVLRGFPDASVDACVTDPPYGLGTKEPTEGEIDVYLRGEARLDTGGDFMGRSWDIPSVALWREVYRVMKPGAPVMAFAGTRTLDLMAAGMEAAGFRYVGTLAWCHGMGFPKSLNVSKAIDKINAEDGRALKFTSWMRTTGLTAKQIDTVLKSAGLISATSSFAVHYFNDGQPAVPTPEIWSVLRPLCDEIPSWVDELVNRVEAEREVVGSFRSSLGGTVAAKRDPQYIEEHRNKVVPLTVPATPEAKRWDGYGTALKPSWEPVLVFTKGESTWQMPPVPFFYCAKATKSERDVEGEVENTHVTVKPLRLMRWLVGLAAPRGGIVLDPFLGSGTTAAACAEEGRDFVGIERDPQYYEIARKRVGVVKGRADEIARQREAFDLMSELEQE